MELSRFRILQLAVVITLLAARIDAGVSSNRYSVKIGKIQARYFRTRSAMTSECGAAADIGACTVFAAERLSCSCIGGAGRWHMVAEASFVPIMLFYDRRTALLHHERIHIVHVQGMLVRYLDDLTSRTYATETECIGEARAESAESAFVQRMNEFRRYSNALLH